MQLLLIFNSLTVEPYKTYSTHLLHKNYFILYWDKYSREKDLAGFGLFWKNKSSQN